MNRQVIVSPIATQHTDTVTCVPPWYIQNTEYAPVPGSYEPLINGEDAFKAVHLAIAQATKTVDIICWGFQPSMYFIRDGRALSIGDLLMSKALEGVKVRVLGWEYPLNFAGMAGEGNLPGKGALRLWDQALQSATKKQYEYDKQWFKACEAADAQAAARSTTTLPIFVSRGFSWDERMAIIEDVKHHGRDPDVSLTTRLVQFASPSHHQKSVLVDYELPDRAVGFVMGHNMLDEYWDTNDHSALDRHPDTKPAPNRGARGFTPRQDISCQVSGPILEYLHHNFAMAWKKETGEDLMGPRDAKKVGLQLCPLGPVQLLQILRTQPQVGKRDIEAAYLNAINNATQFIYIENQYFRWPPLAEAIKQAAERLTAKGRNPALNGTLHLFVITNDTEDGMGAGTVNTQRMLESLGRADTMPEVTKLRRIEQVRNEVPRNPWPNSRDAAGRSELRDWRTEQARRVQEIRENTVLPNRDIPGLKVHMCSLVAPDSPAGQPWMPVYVHSKLMIVDDVYTIQGSANINTRSMQVDTELNIAHEWRSVTQKLRRRLWGLHTKGKGGQDDTKLAFGTWEEIMSRNNDFRNEELPPEGSLVEFGYSEAVLSDLD